MNAAGSAKASQMTRAVRSIAYGAFVAAVFPAVVMLGLTMTVMIFGAMAGGPGAAAAVAPFSIYALAVGYADYGVEGVAFGAVMAGLHYFRLRWLDWRLAAAGVFVLMVLSTMSRGPGAGGPGTQVHPETVLLVGGLTLFILAAQWWARRGLPRERPVDPSSLPFGRRVMIAATYAVCVPMLTAIAYTPYMLISPFVRETPASIFLLTALMSVAGAVLLACVVRSRVTMVSALWTQLPVWSLVVFGAASYDRGWLALLAFVALLATGLVTLLTRSRLSALA